MGIFYCCEPQFTLSRSGDPERRVLDISRAKKELGYSPNVALEEGLRRTLAWMAAQRQ